MQILHSGVLHSVNLGRAQPLRAGGRTVLSGIGKHAVHGAVWVGRMGLVAGGRLGGGVGGGVGGVPDEVADLSVHGGLDKAVYAYPVEHTAFWLAARLAHGASMFNEALPAGYAGENFSVSGLLEHSVYVGDVLQFAHCALQVTAPREPCFKFNAVMGFAQAAKLMVTQRRCGFYLNVVQEGPIAAGEAFTLQPGRRALSIADAIYGKRAKHLR